MSSDFERKLSLPRALAAIGAQGFRWDRFQEYFPFGNLELREGEYLSLVEAALESFATKDDRQLLLDLLDIQWCVFIEQVWVANERTHDTLTGAEMAHARIAIGESLRRKHELPLRRVRKAMFRLREGDTLLQDFLLGNERKPYSADNE